MGDLTQDIFREKKNLSHCSVALMLSGAEYPQVPLLSVEKDLHLSGSGLWSSVFAHSCRHCMCNGMDAYVGAKRLPAGILDIFVTEAEGAFALLAG